MSLLTGDGILGDYVTPLSSVSYCVKVKAVEQMFVEMQRFDLLPAAPKTGRYTWCNNAHFV